MNVHLAGALMLWKTLPVVGKGIAIGALALLILGVSSGVGTWVSHRKDRQFDEQRAAEAKDRANQERVTQAAIEKAQAAEAQAAILQTQVDALMRSAADAKKTAAQKAKDAEVIERETEKGIAAVADLPADEAAADTRERLRRLGYLPR